MTSRTLVALRIAATPQRVFEAFTRVTVEHVGWDALPQAHATASSAGLPAPAGRVVATAAHKCERVDDRAQPRAGRRARQCHRPRAVSLVAGGNIDE